MPDATHTTRQLHIVHLSDLHFGNDHRFMAPAPVSGGAVLRPGFPSLLDKLKQDFAEPAPIENLIICLTGDFATNPENDFEFERAEQFVRGLAQTKIHGEVRGLNNIFLIPGNHDVQFDKPTLGQRWKQYANFLSRIRSKFIDQEKPNDLVDLYKRDDLGAAILCLNSEVYVQRDRDNQYRGEVDQEQIDKVDGLVSGLPDDYIKIALIHHHPILIPDLAESGRDYDAVENVGPLLRILRDKGFHAILHGHKHNPFVFTEDSQSAWTTTTRQPIVIVAGGSVGSRGTPDSFLYRGNCYNRITIKWHPAARQSRIHIETRGLSVFRPDGEEDLAKKWTWYKLREYDIPFFASQCRPKAVDDGVRLETAVRDGMNQIRISEYSRLRGNMPVVEVLPSLVKDQAYEARVWIVPHDPRDIPAEVLWTAGPKFPGIRTTAAQSKWFCTSFQYWGPMLIQAHFKFTDGKSEYAHIYARMPEDCS